MVSRDELMTRERELEGRMERKMARMAGRGDMTAAFRRLSKLERVAREKGWEVDETVEILEDTSVGEASGVLVKREDDEEGAREAQAGGGQQQQGEDLTNW